MSVRIVVVAFTYFCCVHLCEAIDILFEKSELMEGM